MACIANLKTAQAVQTKKKDFLMSRTIKFTLVGVVGVLAIGALAVPWYSARTVAAELKNLTTPLPRSDLVLRKLAHQAGLFSSKGSVEIAWHPHCAPVNAQEPMAFKIDYSVSHLPTWEGLNRFEWTASLLGNSDTVIRQLLDAQGQLSGQGAITYAGLVQNSVALPEINFTSGSEKIQVTPSQGRLAVGKTALQFDWGIDRAVLRGNGQAMEIKQLSLALDLSNRGVGAGTISLGVESFSASTFSLVGLRISSDTRETGDRLNSNITESIRSAQFMGQSLKDLKIDAAVNDLHTPSVRTLTTHLGARCGMDNMTADENQQVRDALKTLISSGLSFGIAVLKGSSQSGGLDGHLEVALLPTKGGPISLATQLKSAGQMTLTGSVVTPEQKQFALTTGFVREVQGGLQATFDYQAGLLKVSGKALDAGLFQNTLVKADEAINYFLSTISTPSSSKSEVKNEDKEALILEESAAPPPATAPATPAAMSEPDMGEKTQDQYRTSWADSTWSAGTHPYRLAAWVDKGKLPTFQAPC